mmetsp:Transcript_39782/g.40553  ORF Transcript_39782/g.40553 Transcript_39782/m.40553 type:complete len:157 (-) Transcript_39782:199-669(-)
MTLLGTGVMQDTLNKMFLLNSLSLSLSLYKAGVRGGRERDPLLSLSLINNTAQDCMFSSKTLKSSLDNMSRREREGCLSAINSAIHSAFLYKHTLSLSLSFFLSLSLSFMFSFSRYIFIRRNIYNLIYICFSLIMYVSLSIISLLHFRLYFIQYVM